MALFTLPAGNDLIQYDINDAQVFVNNLDGTFGPGVNVPSIDLFVSTINNKNQTMRGDARITAIASGAESAECQFRFGSFNMQVMQIILGSVYSYSGTTPNRKTQMDVGAGQTFPYFGIVGRSPSGLGNAGATLIFLPCCKLMQNLAVRVDYNNFMIPEVTGMAVGDPVLVDPAGNPLLIRYKMYETSPNIAIPLP